MSNSTSSSNNQKNKYEEAIASVKKKELKSSSADCKANRKIHCQHGEIHLTKFKKQYSELLANLYRDEKAILNEGKKRVQTIYKR